MIPSGLSVDQAPPISVPFRFFLTAPLFNLLAAAVLLWRGPEAFESRWSPAALAVTHLVTLGFMTMVMFGAVMQILPVLAGSPVPRAMMVAVAAHSALVLGTLALAGGFLFAQPLLIEAAVVLLGIAFSAFIAAVAVSLSRARTKNDTVRVMWFAVAALIVTVSLGLSLASSRGWGTALPNAAMIDLHPGWGLLGWTGLLVAGVAFQVVPMFQITPPYPSLVMRWFSGAVFALLIGWSAARWLGATAAAVGLAVVLAAAYASFAAVTLRLQYRRRRRIPDVTLNFWRVGMVTAIAGGAVWAVLVALPDQVPARTAVLVGVLAIVGFAVSVINGMLYKIAPFLAWFHLQSVATNPRQVPHMKKILPDDPARRQMWTHFAAFALLVLAVAWPQVFVYPAAIVFAASALMLWRNLLRVLRVFRDRAPDGAAPDAADVQRRAALLARR